ncbi:MAG: glutamyl-tRNA synthetase, partial [Thermoproteota archaeon]|nr:glutamyl-tRNA synthetase [Thermoproteota archaeon]
NAPLIHWIPDNSGVPTSAVMPDASLMNGVAEDDCRKLNVGDIIQFERFGFVRIDAMGENMVVYYAHR